MANSPAIITATFPIGKRGKALGILAMFVSAGLVSGPSIGGFLITELGWRSIFFVNIAIGILGFILVHRFVTTDTPPEHQSFDWTGAFLQTLLLLSFIVVVDPPSISFSGNSPLPIPRLLMIGITIALAVIFVKVEAEAKAPLFDLSLLQNRTFWTGNLAMLLLYVSYSAMTIMMPFYFEEVLDFTPDKAGLFMTAIPLTIFIVAPIAGRLSDKLGSRELSFIGSTIATIGLLMMSGIFGPGIDNHSTPFQIILGLCMIGLATGLFQSPNNNAIMTSVPANKLGVASAFTATIRNLAFVTGTGMATGLFAWRFDQNHDFVNALHTTLLVAGLVAIGAMVASLGKKGGPLQKK
jgi:MFS family permease